MHDLRWASVPTLSLSLLLAACSMESAPAPADLEIDGKADDATAGALVISTLDDHVVLDRVRGQGVELRRSVDVAEGWQLTPGFELPSEPVVTRDDEWGMTLSWPSDTFDDASYHDLRLEPTGESGRAYRAELHTVESSRDRHVRVYERSQVQVVELSLGQRLTIFTYDPPEQYDFTRDPLHGETELVAPTLSSPRVWENDPELGRAALAFEDTSRFAVGDHTVELRHPGGQFSTFVLRVSE